MSEEPQLVRVICAVQHVNTIQFSHLVIPKAMCHKKVSVSSLSVGPILVVEPRPVTVDVDSDVTLNCKWSGNPPLTLTWTKKGSNMVRTNHHPQTLSQPVDLEACTLNYVLFKFPFLQPFFIYTGSGM